MVKPGGVEIWEQENRNYYDNLPAGYRFKPTSQELIDFLYRKVSKLPLLTKRIPELIHLHNFHPQQLTSMFEMFREEELYFFTTISKIHLNDHQRYTQSVVSGLWVAIGVEEDIYDDKHVKLGTEKTYFYYEMAKDNKVCIKSDWIMKEYRTESSNANNVGQVINEVSIDSLLEEWVVCKIYKMSDVEVKFEGESDVEDEFESEYEESYDD